MGQFNTYLLRRCGCGCSSRGSPKSFGGAVGSRRQQPNHPSPELKVAHLGGSRSLRRKEREEIVDADAGVEQRDHLLRGNTNLLPVPHELLRVRQ